ncbi:hypothetical protein BX661DRAFT_50635 [Kickxella alabastrina]|uniref:uncharacterized protein n=1 Tax=Kickxella alabastrina TaxID=61397 RepID=UPI00221FD46D|nr:uncharacterized protein BX661DRAFT_50635 [Kickxella alabastrina]KAI7834236.1 hypothetical protein BX661DRAFT_50635 [Kickxella alabastrina]
MRIALKRSLCTTHLLLVLTSVIVLKSVNADDQQTEPRSPLVSPPPSATTGTQDFNVHPESIVQRLAELEDVELNDKQGVDLKSELVGELNRLVSDTANIIGRPREDVYNGIDALIRARTRGRPRPKGEPRMHVNPKDLIGLMYNDGSRKFFGRMFSLFHQLASAYVKSVSANGFDTSTSTTSTTMGASVQLTSEESSEPKPTPTPTPIPTSSENTTSTSATASSSTSKSSISTTSSKKNSSAKSTSSDVDYDDDDDEDDDEYYDEDDEGDSENGSEHSDKKPRNGNGNSTGKSQGAKY